METTPVPGRMPGDYCPACPDGLLVVVERDQFWSKWPSGGSGGLRATHPKTGTTTFIDRLACCVCSASFESRIRSASHYITEQVKNPKIAQTASPREPSCTNCGHTKPVVVDKPIDRMARPYHYCPTCLTVWWIGFSVYESSTMRRASDGT